MKKSVMTAAFGLAMAFGIALPGTAQAECGRVTIADMNWKSASLMANIDRFILEHGFGCEAELVPGDTMPTGTSMMEKGEPDVAPELWTNSFTEALDTAVSEGRLVIAGKSLSDGGEEGFWVPKYMVEENPELATLEGVLKNPDLFPNKENPSKAAFLGCPAGWGCQLSSSNIFKAANMDEAGFEYVDPGSGAALAGSIAKAYERGEAWFGYYWAPTAVLGNYEMVKVDFGSGVKEDHFKNCLAKDICEDPQVSMYPPSPVLTVTTADFSKKAPQVYDYFTRRSFTNADMNKLLAWMETEQAEGGMASEYVLKNHENLWTSWVSAEVAAKVKKALSEL